ncbi:hypothetical protein RBU61_05935 [Tissierella sp. MB52-C2]|uniref:hypothetical protein n=1 Tax=Tissierella sp. MB52-C2 TaxID=3070999 RepID=UPI00280AE921|nr:hypothetical protein [Tissierella sp. MB52-C2]WMM26213.1 hypothetical protein RBU61_05935 [Tissierella sp. MB52-C2]
MENQIVICFLLLLCFVSGSAYNFRIRKQCIYRVRLTRLRIITLIIASLIFCGIAYIGGNSWDNYLIAFSAIVFIISGVVAEGIHERGIYYQNGRGLLVRLGKWEDIKDVKFDINKDKLKSFKINTLTIFANQYYSSEDIDKINKYIEK